MDDDQWTPRLVAGSDFEAPDRDCDEDEERLRFLNEEGLAMLAAYRRLDPETRQLALKLVQTLAGHRPPR